MTLPRRHPPENPADKRAAAHFSRQSGIFRAALFMGTENTRQNISYAKDFAEKITAAPAGISFVPFHFTPLSILCQYISHRNYFFHIFIVGQLPVILTKDIFLLRALLSNFRNPRSACFAKPRFVMPCPKTLLRKTAFSKKTSYCR